MLSKNNKKLATKGTTNRIEVEPSQESPSIVKFVDVDDYKSLVDEFYFRKKYEAIAELEEKFQTALKEKNKALQEFERCGSLHNKALKSFYDEISHHTQLWYKGNFALSKEEKEEFRVIKEDLSKAKKKWEDADKKLSEANEKLKKASDELDTAYLPFLTEEFQEERDLDARDKVGSGRCRKKSKKGSGGRTKKKSKKR